MEAPNTVCFALSPKGASSRDANSNLMLGGTWGSLHRRVVLVSGGWFGCAPALFGGWWLVAGCGLTCLCVYGRLLGAC